MYSRVFSTAICALLRQLAKALQRSLNIYDDYVRLLQYPFPSPIGRTAISFYHYYIEDTVYVERHLCYHLQFIPPFSSRTAAQNMVYYWLNLLRCTVQRAVQYMEQGAGIC